MNDKEKRIIESFSFKIHESEKEYDLETWTNGGVNMFINLDKSCWKEELYNYSIYFDIDSEIDILRENDDSYRESFTIRESLDDFENYVNTIANMITELESAGD